MRSWIPGAALGHDRTLSRGYQVRRGDEGWEIRRLGWLRPGPVLISTHTGQQAAIDAARVHARRDQVGVRWHGPDGALLGRLAHPGQDVLLPFGLRRRRRLPPPAGRPSAGAPT